MKKSAAVFFVLLILSANFAFSESNTTVTVKNQVNSTSNNQANHETNIKIETNGKVTTYSSNKADDIEVNSINGESEIKVNGVKISVTPNPTTEIIKTKTETKEITDDKKESKEQEISTIIEDFIKKIFSFFR